MGTIEFHSHEQQDEFVYNLFGKDYKGFFLDIACGHPIVGNNTYTLEKSFGWNGICFDIDNMERTKGWSKIRTAKFVQMDATSDHLTTYLKNNLDPNKIIDYISLDVDTTVQNEQGQVWSVNSSFVVLQKIIKAGVRFKALTLEHEFYKFGDTVAKPSRELLESLGYVRLFEDVKLVNIEADPATNFYFEDWWIDPRFFDDSVLRAAMSKIYYFDCIDHLKSSMKNDYTATHVCSKAWLNEYTHFHTKQEEEQLLRDISQLQAGTMKVYDCFTFYNEFDLLELRLEELWDVVDYFVIAEANTTHQSQPKAFLLEERWGDFAKYHSKIRHIKVDDMPCNPNTWINENWQRRALARGLYDMQPEDIIIVGDGDEIVRPEVIEAIKEDPNDYNRYIPYLPLFYFKLNYLMVNPCGIHGKAVVTRGRAFMDPQREREVTFPWVPKPANLDWCFINHGGWHFSYLGKTEFAKNKIQSFAHAETNIPDIVDRLDVDEMIKRKLGIGWEQGEERFAYVKVEDYLPQTVVNNLERWKDFIIPEQEFSVYDFYPDVELTPENLNEHINRTNGTFLQQYRKLTNQ